jgi:hypothetical protein
MSDPLSTAASIVALSQLAAKVFSYLRDIKNGPAECKSIMVEVTLVRGLLVSLEDTVNASGSESWASAMEALNHDKGPLAQVRHVLETLHNEVEGAVSKGRGTRVANALQWPFRKAEAASLLNSLERQKTLLALVLQNDHIALSREIQAEVSSISATVNSIHATLQGHHQHQDGTLS